MTRAGFDDESLDGSTRVLAVTGELDLNNVGDLRRRIARMLADGPPRIVVDLSNVTHMDSSGLAELITAYQRAVSAGGGLALVVTSPQLRRTLEIRGVRDLFTIVTSREEAMAALGGPRT